MLSFCLNCRKNTWTKNPNVERTKKQKNNALIKMCSDSKKYKFIKEQQASRLLSSLEIKSH